jgi:hypothetical protein
MIGARDSAMIGNLSNPFLLQVYLQYRGEPSLLQATNAEANPATTLFNMFSSLTSSRLTGDLGQVRPVLVLCLLSKDTFPRALMLTRSLRITTSSLAGPFSTLTSTA